MSLTRRTLAKATLAAPFLGSVASAAEPIRLRASLDTTPSHGRTIAVADYLKKLEAASNGQIVGQMFDSGQLFADRDVTKALVQGSVDMAVPGTWLISGFVPDADMVQLPAFYGLTLDAVHRVIDGKPGQTVNDQLAKKLKVQVIGPWLDLGFNNWYSTKKKLTSLSDLAGLKIRNSGGFAQAWRTTFFGGVANMTAWPEVPLALSQGTFDALITTNESIASAKLWDAGLRYALEDHMAVGEYIPLFSGAFWSKLTPDLQILATRVWADNISTYRANMARAQSRAHDEMVAHGVSFTVLPPEELTVARRRQLAEQDKVAREMKISPDLLAAIMQELGGV